MSRYRCPSERRGERQRPECFASSDECGAMAVTIGLFMFFMLGVSLAAIKIGELSIAKRELQNAADAAALYAAYKLEQQGIPLVTAGADELIGRNTWVGPVAQYQVNLIKTANDGACREDHPCRCGRRRVEVRLQAEYDIGTTILGGRRWPVTARSAAQINEMVCGAYWPALLFVLDGSRSMGSEYPTLLGRASAFEVLEQAFEEYARRSLPVRNGAIIFNDGIVVVKSPPATNDVNTELIQDAIRSARNRGLPARETNTYLALHRAVELLSPFERGRNVLLISDGEPTTSAPKCATPRAPCNWTDAVQQALALRRAAPAGASLFSLEIRRRFYDRRLTEFLSSIVGPPIGFGAGSYSVSDYHRSVGTGAQIRAFINEVLSSAVCSFGPLVPGPAVQGELQSRPTARDLLGPPLRLQLFIRSSDGKEQPVPKVQDRNVSGPGWQFSVGQDGGVYAILTEETCGLLGQDAERRVVLRWDDAQLVW